jgi:hypothetical protein
MINTLIKEENVFKTFTKLNAKSTNLANIILKVFDVDFIIHLNLQNELFILLYVY